MSTWLTRLAERLAGLVDPANGPWNPRPADWANAQWIDPGGADADADLRRMSRDLDAVRVRFAEPR